MNECVMSPPRRMNSRKMRLRAPHLSPTTATLWYYCITYSLCILITCVCVCVQDLLLDNARRGPSSLSYNCNPVVLCYWLVICSFIYSPKTPSRDPHFSPTTATLWYYFSMYLCIPSWKTCLRAPHLSHTTATLLDYLYGT